MTTTTIDNSALSDLQKTITWQYDNATNLKSVIFMLADFFEQSTEDFWDGIAERLNLSEEIDTTSSTETTLHDFGLSIWGKLLGVPRPVVTVTVDGESVTRKINSELYRRLLAGRLRLAMSDASVDAYEDFVSFVFTDGEDVNVSISDGGNMSLSFAYTKTTDLTEDDLEQKALVENSADLVFAYPAGVKSASESDGPVLGFYEQVRDADGDPLTTNEVIDDQSVQTTTYTYTKNGYTYTKSHKDFKIANLDHGTIAWDRFSS